MKYKKAVAIILALVLTLQPLCALRHSYALGTAAAEVRISGIDEETFAAHFSAFFALFHRLCFTLQGIVDGIKALGIWNFLPFLHKGGIIPDIIEKIERDPPGAFSI